MRRSLLVMVALTLALVPACNRGADTPATTAPAVDATTTTTEAAPGTTEAAPETTPETTTTTIAPSLIELEYVVRFKGVTDGKNIVVLQIDEGTATDIALESLAREAIDAFEPLSELFVVDAEDAVELVRLDPGGLTDAENDVLSQHYLMHVKEAVLTFKGPFGDLQGFVLGS